MSLFLYPSNHFGDLVQLFSWYYDDWSFISKWEILYLTQQIQSKFQCFFVYYNYFNYSFEYVIYMTDVIGKLYPFYSPSIKGGSQLAWILFYVFKLTSLPIIKRFWCLCYCYRISAIMIPYKFHCFMFY